MPFDHYISQSILKQWGDPNVWVFDFASGELDRPRVDSTFGRTGLNDPRIEQLLGSDFETLLGEFRAKDRRARLRDYLGEPIERLHHLNNRKERRALALALIGQTARTADFEAGTSSHLESLLTTPDDQLEVVVDLLLAQNDLVTVSAFEGQHFLLPGCGFFGFPVTRKGTPIPTEWGHALPLEPRVALVSVPKGATDIGSEEFIGSLAGYSIGLTSRRVVVPDEIVDSFETQAALKARLVAQREAAKALVGKVELRALEYFEAIRFLDSLLGTPSHDQRE